MTPIRFTHQAATDIDRQVEWLAERAPAAAIRATEQIYLAIDGLADYPESAPVGDGGLRELQVRFGRDGFTVRYRFRRGRVTILRVFHGRQQR